MAQVAFPTAATQRIVHYSPQLWSPGLIVHRLRDGRLSAPLERAPWRWRGTVTFGPAATMGERDDVAAVELFLAQMADPSNWCWMPWGGDEPFYPTPKDFSPGRVTATLNGVHTLLRHATSTGLLNVGDWLLFRPRFGRSSIVTVASVSGINLLAPQITTVPVVQAKVDDRFYPATHIQVRQRDPDGQGVMMPRTASYGGAVTWQWEEVK